MGYTVSQVANMALAVEDRHLAELREAGASGGADIITALRDLAARCNQLVQAQAQASQVLMAPELARDYKLATVRSLISDALSAAQAAVQTYTAAMDNAASKLGAVMLPKKPAGADPMTAFQAEQATKLLESAAANGGNVTVTASRLLADALASGDETTSFVVAGGPLALVYKRLGVDAGKLQATFANVIGRAHSSDGTPPAGAKLLAALSSGGGSVQSLRGFRDIANITLYNEVQSFNKSLDAYVALGVVQNGPQNAAS